MLKKLYLFVFLFIFVTAISEIPAQDKTIGAGIKLGEPSGITVKYWLNQRNAFDLTLGFALFNSNSRVNINLNYLYHYYNVIETQKDVDLFVGFGARLLTRAHNNSTFGVRGVGGASMDLAKYPIEVFLEASPVFRLFPTTGLDFDMSIGARYYFE